MLLRCESRLQPRDGRMAHTIATRNIHQGVARRAPCQSLLPLMRRELVRAAKAHAALFGTLAAFTRPGANQPALGSMSLAGAPPVGTRLEDIAL
jgi:hypothetical protein